MDGGLLLAGYLTGQPRLLVRYAADARHFRAAARHEKGGGCMTYIENIFICMVSPLLVAALCMGRRQLRFFLFCIAGMGVCL
ncbi:MAG: PrsW family intramembrane metalloprotease, partial [Clostridiales bacterium]|nr:PrsW family intramembrane metalloprotease [Clostridiales bacterium]